MATIPVEPACPIRFISFRLAARGSTEARDLFIDGEGQIRAAPHWPIAATVAVVAQNLLIAQGNSGRTLHFSPRVLSWTNGLQTRERQLDLGYSY